MEAKTTTKRSYFKLIISSKDCLNKIKRDVSLKLITTSFIKKAYETVELENSTCSKIVYFFQTSERKRESQIIKLINEPRKLERIAEINFQSFTKKAWLQNVAQHVIKKELKTLNLKEDDNYDGKDLNLFYKKTEWQNQIVDHLFDQSNIVKTPDIKKILYIRGPLSFQNSETWYFFKYLFYNYSNEIVKIKYTTLNEFWSRLFKLSPKLIYFIQIEKPVKMNKKIKNAIETLQLGIIYKHEAIVDVDTIKLLNPPHVIVISDASFNPKWEDKRWRFFQIHENKLVEIN